LSVAVFVWLLLPCNSIISNADGLLTAAFTTSTGDRVQRGEEMFRTWMIAGIALAASTGPTLGQDAAAGEQVFKRLCSPCHEIGQDAKIKLGPPLNGIDGRKSGTFDGFNYSPANKSSGITWSEENFPQVYPRADARNAGHPHGICRHQKRQGHRRALGLSQAVRG
jgi:cytochrome c